jgi:hypothetical protein
MTRDCVIEKVCKIVARVHAASDGMHASDCFCRMSPQGGSFHHEGKTLEFVRQAVAEKLAKENPNFDLQFYLKINGVAFVATFWVKNEYMNIAATGRMRVFPLRPHSRDSAIQRFINSQVS